MLLTVPVEVLLWLKLADALIPKYEPLTDASPDVVLESVLLESDSSVDDVDPDTMVASMGTNPEKVPNHLKKALTKEVPAIKKKLNKKKERKEIKKTITIR